MKYNFITSPKRKTINIDIKIIIHVKIFIEKCESLEKI